MGYGGRALQALNSFYSGEYFNLDETAQPEPSYPDPAAIGEETDLLTDQPTVRSATAMPPLLQRLTERKPETLDYLGVSYGLTPQLLRFWKRAGYVPLYVRQTQSELTGEHTCVMARGLNTSTDSELEWLGEFAKGVWSWITYQEEAHAHCWCRLPKTVLVAAVLQVSRVWERYCAQHP